MEELQIIQTVRTQPAKAAAAKPKSEGKGFGRMLGEASAEIEQKDAVPETAVAEVPVVLDAGNVIVPAAEMSSVFAQAVAPDARTLVGMSETAPRIAEIPVALAPETGVKDSAALTPVVQPPKDGGEIPKTEQRPVTAPQTAETPAAKVSETEIREVKMPVPVFAGAAEKSAESTVGSGNAELPVARHTEEKTGTKAVSEPLSDDKLVFLKDIVLRSEESGGVPVKVAENFDAGKAEFPAKLAEEILYRAEGDAKQFDVELYPKELGKLKVSVVFENGKATVTLLCENARAQQILSSHAENIRSIVEQNSGHETDINVHKNSEESAWQREKQDGGQEREQQRQNRKPKKDEIDIFIDRLKMGMRLDAV